jgi:hypothetical protein
MIDLKSYIASQQCAWFKRLSNGCNDTYKDMLVSVVYDKLGSVRPGAFNINENPVLGNICASFDTFYECFIKDNSNWKKSSVLYNPILKNNRG